MNILPPASNRVRIVSFSGMDGAGKSTQIEALYTRLCMAGVRVQLLAFWDDVARLGWLREFSSHALFKSEKGVGSPEKPVARRDKNVKAWYLTAVRLFLYLVDAVSLRMVVARAQKSDAEIIIFDRYLYDELANLSLNSRLTQAYVRWLLKLVPRPDIAYLLDADPEQARERKPEYPVEFLHRNRASYLFMRALVGGITVIEAMPRIEVERMVMQELSSRVLCRMTNLARLGP